MKVYENFTEAYVDIVKDVYTNPEFISTPRGMKVKEILGYQFRILNPRNRIPYVPGRELSVHYMIAELLWYLSGNDSTEWISNYSAFWSKISDDGKTANSAYGARIFKPHSRIAASVDEAWTQWDYVVNELKNDPDSRRAVVHIRSPQDSILAGLDVPCTLSLQFFLRNDKVHMTVSMRSSDVILGLSYDVPAFTIFQELLALQLTQELGRPIGLGSYTHLSASLHLYERHFKMAEKILEEDKKQDYRNVLEMPPMSSVPPLEDLMAAESEIRKCMTIPALSRTISSTNLKNSYWNDWCRVLASHKAIKLNDKQTSNDLLLFSSFEGYRFFGRTP
ncbi:MAG: thymidylate synthase [Chlamydiae bacterium]|nr:thymidylate synthase [Chlamydiota bacterium]